MREILENKRGSGRTTQQMLSSPHGAYFIWVNDIIDYPEKLAKHLKREDLKIFGRSTLSVRPLYARDIPALVLDHAFENITSAEIDAYNLIIDEIRTRQSRCKNCED